MGEREEDEDEDEDEEEEEEEERVEKKVLCSLRSHGKDVAAVITGKSHEIGHATRGQLGLSQPL